MMKLSAKQRSLVLRRLKRARALFGPSGEHWVKGRLKEGEDNYCAVGAVSVAGGSRDGSYSGGETYRNTIFALARNLPNPYLGNNFSTARHAVVMFNDGRGSPGDYSFVGRTLVRSPDQERDRVMKLFEKTACELEQEG